MFYFWWLVQSSQEPPSWAGGENFPECLRLFCLYSWFSQGPVVLLQHDLASISYDTVTLWPPVTSASVTVGPGPGSILPGTASLLEVLLALSWAPPTSLRQVLGSRSSCPEGQHHPQLPPPAPQLWSSLPCSLREGLQSDFQGVLRRFRINAWFHHCLLWMR